MGKMESANDEQFLKVELQSKEFTDKSNAKTSTRRFSLCQSYVDVNGMEKVIEFSPVPSGFENAIVLRSADLPSHIGTDWAFHLEIATNAKKAPSETCTVLLKRLKQSIGYNTFVQILVTLTCKCSKLPISSLAHPLDFITTEVFQITADCDSPIALAKHKHDELIDEHRYSPEFQIMITEYDISQATSVPFEIQKLMARKSCAREIKHIYTKLLQPYDVTIKCRRGIEFAAHKDILAARSPVFKEMLSNECKQGKPGTVNIHDLSGDAMQVVIYFIYHGGLHEIWRSCAEEIVCAADRYNLPLLKQFFDHLLLQVCNTGNALRLLQLAERHSLPNAVKTISKFVDDNLEQIVHESVNLEPKRK